MTEEVTSVDSNVEHIEDVSPTREPSHGKVPTTSVPLFDFGATTNVVAPLNQAVVTVDNRSPTTLENQADMLALFDHTEYTARTAETAAHTLSLFDTFDEAAKAPVMELLAEKNTNLVDMAAQYIAADSGGVNIDDTDFSDIQKRLSTEFSADTKGLIAGIHARHADHSNDGVTQFYEEQALFGTLLKEMDHNDTLWDKAADMVDLFAWPDNLKDMKDLSQVGLFEASDQLNLLQNVLKTATHEQRMRMMPIFAAAIMEVTENDAYQAEHLFRELFMSDEDFGAKGELAEDLLVSTLYWGITRSVVEQGYKSVSNADPKKMLANMGNTKQAGEINAKRLLDIAKSPKETLTNAIDALPATASKWIPRQTDEIAFETDFALRKAMDEATGPIAKAMSALSDEIQMGITAASNADRRLAELVKQEWLAKTEFETAEWGTLQIKTATPIGSTEAQTTTRIGDETASGFKVALEFEQKTKTVSHIVEVPAKSVRIRKGEYQLADWDIVNTARHAGSTEKGWTISKGGDLFTPVASDGTSTMAKLSKGKYDFLGHSIEKSETGAWLVKAHGTETWSTGGKTLAQAKATVEGQRGVHTVYRTKAEAEEAVRRIDNVDDMPLMEKTVINVPDRLVIDVAYKEGIHGIHEPIAANIPTLGTIKGLIATPTRKLEDWLPNAVGQATFSQRRATELARALTEVADDALKGLNKADVKALEQNLAAADLQQDLKVTTRMLKEGIPDGGTPMTDKQVIAYAKTRELYKGLHSIADRAAADTYAAKGFVEILPSVRVSGIELPTTVAKPVSISEIGATTSVHLPKQSASGASDLTVEQARELIEEGTHQLMELGAYGHRLSGTAKPITESASKVATPDKDWIKYVLIKNENIGGRPQAGVLPYLRNYSPKIRKNVFHVVRERFENSVQGVKEIDWRATHLFNSKKEANAYMREQENLSFQAWKSAGEQGKYQHKFTTHKDGEVAVEQVSLDTGLLQGTSDEALNMAVLNAREDAAYKQFGGGGLFGARSNKEPEMVGESIVELGGLAAMNSAITSASARMSMNEIRLGMADKFKSTFGKFLVDPDDVFSKVETHFVSPSGAHEAKLSAEQVRSITEAQDWLKAQMRIPTEREMNFHNKVFKLVDWMENGSNPAKEAALGEGSAQWTKDFLRGTIANGDPFRYARTASFHAHLGMLNPAQLLIQAQQATIAMSLGITSTPKVMTEYLAYQLVKNRTGDVAFVKSVAAKVGMQTDELMELSTIMNDSGVMTAIRSNADVTAAHHGAHFDEGVVGRALEAGTSFYKAGEGFNRGFSFIHAFNKFKQVNGKAPTAQVELEEVMTSATRMSFNLDTANAAHYQSGMFSTGTQFLQIQHKFIDNVFPEMLGGSGKIFSSKEKGRIIAGQFMLYGAAGIPLGKSLGDYLINNGYPGELNDELIAAFDGGATDLITQLVNGHTTEISSRTGLSSGIEDTIMKLIWDEQDIPSLMLGAFGNIPLRGMEVFKTVKPMVMAEEYDVTLDDMQLVATKIASIATTFNNIEKAMMWEAHKAILTKNGEVITYLDPDNSSVFWWKLGGFNPKDVSKLYTAKQDLRARSKLRSKITKEITVLNRQFMVNDNNEDPKVIRNHKAAVALLLATLGEGEQSDVMKRALNNSFGESMKDKTAKLHLKTIEKGGDIDLRSQFGK